MNLIDRETELNAVHESLRVGRNLAVVGLEGVGKTALITEAIRDRSDVLYCGDTSTLKTACESLLAQLRLAVNEADNVARKRAILRTTADKKLCFIFDHVGWVNPKLQAFLENVRASHPMIVVTRSIAWSDMGHLKMILWDFDKLELRPPSRETMLEVLRAQVKRLKLRVPDPHQFEANVLRIADHNLHVLMELCQQAADGGYVFGKHLSTQLLNLDRRIKELGLR
jgi:hypothetical protein